MLLLETRNIDIFRAVFLATTVVAEGGLYFSYRKIMSDRWMKSHLNPSMTQKKKEIDVPPSFQTLWLETWENNG